MINERMGRSMKALLVFVSIILFIPFNGIADVEGDCAGTKPETACRQNDRRRINSGLFCPDNKTIAHSICIWRCENVYMGYLKWILQDESYTVKSTCPSSRPKCINNKCVQCQGNNALNISSLSDERSISPQDDCGQCKRCQNGTCRNYDSEDPGMCLKCRGGSVVNDDSETCNDGNSCTENDYCSGGSCTGQPPLSPVDPSCQ